MKKRNNKLFLKGGLGSSSITWEWHQCGERVKTKSQKVGANFYLCRSYREKTGMGVGLFCPPPCSKFWIGLDRTKTAVLKFVDLVIKNVSDMQTLPITAGDSRFGRFNLSPIRFLESNSNSRFYRDIHTKISKMTYNWQKFYTWTFKCRPRRLRILSSFKLDFPIITM